MERDKQTVRPVHWIPTGTLRCPDPHSTPRCTGSLRIRRCPDPCAPRGTTWILSTPNRPRIAFRTPRHRGSPQYPNRFRIPPPLPLAPYLLSTHGRTDPAFTRRCQNPLAFHDARIHQVSGPWANPVHPAHSYRAAPIEQGRCSSSATSASGPSSGSTCPG
jgi:hypothetical protein